VTCAHSPGLADELFVPFIREGLNRPRKDHDRARKDLVILRGLLDQVFADLVWTSSGHEGSRLRRCGDGGVALPNGLPEGLGTTHAVALPQTYDNKVVGSGTYLPVL
jgi:hypothetical protein